MAVHYIVDGYNVLHKNSVLADQTKEDGRTVLVRLIESEQPQGSLNNQVTVVFDGYRGQWAAPESSPVRVLFSDEESADDKIKKLVDKSSSPRSLIVVTDDREIRYFVKGLGAKIMDADEFLARLIPRRQGPCPAGGKKIDPAVEEKINREFTSLWGRKNKNDKTD